MFFKKETPGGVVNLEGIIQQINAIGDDITTIALVMDGAIAASLDASESSFSSVKDYMGKIVQNITGAVRHIGSELNNLSGQVKSCIESINTSGAIPGDSLAKLFGDINTISAMLDSNPQNAMKAGLQSASKNQLGLIGTLLLIKGMMDFLASIKLSRSVSLYIKMHLMLFSLRIVRKYIVKLSESILSIGTITNGIVNNPMFVVSIKSIMTFICTLNELSEVISSMYVINPIKVRFKLRFILASLRNLRTSIRQLSRIILRIGRSATALVNNPMFFTSVVNIISVIICTNALVYAIENIQTIGPVRSMMLKRGLRRTMKIMRQAINIILIGLRRINTLLFRSRRSISVRKMLRLITILEIVKFVFVQILSIAFVAILALPLLLPAIIGTELGFMMLRLIIKLAVMGIARLVSRRMLRRIRKNARRVARLCLIIVRTIVVIVLTVIAIALSMLICIKVSLMMVKLLGGFLLSMLLIGVIFVVIGLSLKMLAKITRRARNMSIRMMINVILMAVAMMIVSLMLVVLADLSTKISGHLLDILLLLLVVGLVTAGIVGFMILCGTFSVFIMAGVVAVGAVMVGVVVIMILVMTLWLLTIIAEELDADRLKEAVNKVMDVVSFTINTMLNADFGWGGKPDGDQDSVQTLLGQVMGASIAIFNLMARVVMLFFAMLAIGLIIFLILELVALVKLYDNYRASIDRVPEVITGVMAAVSAAIQTIVNADVNMANKPADGAFLELVNYVSPDLATIMVLVFRFIQVALVMIVIGLIMIMLLQLKFLIYEYEKLGGPKLTENIVVVVNDIMTAINNIITILTTPTEDPEGKPKSGLVELLNWLELKDLAQIVGLLCSFVKIGLAIIALGVLMAVAKIMQTCWNAYQAMGGKNITTNAAKMVQGIIDGVNTMINVLKNAKINFGDADKSKLDMVDKSIVSIVQKIFGRGWTGIIDILASADKLSNLLPVIARIESAAKILNETQNRLKSQISSIKTLNDKTLPEFINNVKGIIDTVNNMDLGNTSNMQVKLETLMTASNDISKSINKLLGADGENTALGFLVQRTKQYKIVVDQTDRLVKKINTIDLSKMKAFAEMWMYAAAFSKSISGNFDKLAETLSRKIAPLIKELKEAIETADRHIREYKQQMEAAEKKTSQMLAQVNAKNRELNQKWNQIQPFAELLNILGPDALSQLSNQLKNGEKIDFSKLPATPRASLIPGSYVNVNIASVGNNPIKDGKLRITAI